ncbi:hypothetical protein GGD83_004531 [Rhodoblastus sphagnicola]|nr:hypothetical protein [Rhodoblastus sphagnicola]MBB4200702.1 hypothetical protein [Rhodoblastus sphagnicola]
MPVDSAHAKKISDHALRASDHLNSILIELLDGADTETAATSKELIGSLLGEIYFGILRPIHDKYPELAPEDLRPKS